ncbi:hypothetical protein AB0I22_38985 [Streptomyces sp. NPDC050610]
MGRTGPAPSLQPLVDMVDAYNDSETVERKQAIVAEAQRLLAGPRPPLD